MIFILSSKSRPLITTVVSFLILLSSSFLATPAKGFSTNNNNKVISPKLSLTQKTTTNLSGEKDILSKSNNNDNNEISRRDILKNTVLSTVMASSMLLMNREKANADFISRGAVNGLQDKIRSICYVMDELQRDLMQERWDLLEDYPVQLRSYVPIFTTYTDSAFPSDLPTDYSLRVALRYEVGRFFGSLERLKREVQRRNLPEAYMAYSEMAIHFDRYMHVGNLYPYEDNIVDYSKFYEGVDDKSLIFANPKKDPAEVRDLVVLVEGADKGKTGIVIGVYLDGSNKCVVKLDKYLPKYPMREIRILNRDVVAKRLGEQDPDNVFLIPRKNENLITANNRGRI